MTGLMIRFCLVLFLGLGFAACAMVASSTSGPTPIAADNEAEAQADLEASDQICSSVQPDDRYRRTYYNTADEGEGERVSSVAGWGRAQIHTGLPAAETVFFVAYCDMREAGLSQIEAHNQAANLALQNEGWLRGRVEGYEALQMVTPYKPLVAAPGPAPNPTPERQDEITPTVTRPPFIWAADRTPTPSPTAPMPTPTPTAIDYDEDNDGLIEVRTLAQLNAIRWDVLGLGQAYSDEYDDEYQAAFPKALDDMGCPTDGCSGYELAADLDFDTNSNGQSDAGDAYWNGGGGWEPLPGWDFQDQDGSGRIDQSATFEGNGHTVANLYGRSLFIRNFDTISNLVLTGNVDGEYGNWNCGALVCSNDNDGIISGVTVIGSVNGPGGLVGENHGTIQNSAARVTVYGGGSTGGAGGLVGYNTGVISDSTASGLVSGANYDPNRGPIDVGAGGLVGTNTGTISDSSASTTVSWPYRVGNVGGLVGTNRGGITNSTATGDVSAPSECKRFGQYECNIVGGLVGLNDGYKILNSTATGAVSGHSNVGGLVGVQRLGEVIGSEATGVVTGTAWSIGGLVGDNMSTIRDSTASGAVSGENVVGGLAGVNSGKIERSEASGAVSGMEHVGGLVGRNDSFEGISRSEASGYVDGYSYVGGLVGATYGTIRDSEASGDVKGVEYVGGLAGGVGGDRESVGFEIGGALSDTKASGYVSGAYYVGGLAGWNSGTISDSQASGYVSGKYQADALVGANEGGIIRNSTGTGKVSAPR